ncbi:unnamed protein product, partial [Rotaria magnacalcarata]
MDSDKFQIISIDHLIEFLPVKSTIEF